MLPFDVLPSHARTASTYAPRASKRGLVLLAVLLLGAAGAQQVTLERVADGFERPVGVATDGVHDDRVYVLEQPGTVRVVKDGAVVPEPFLDLRDRVLAGHERGLLGLAFHPQYPRPPEVFVHYTDTDGDTRVVRMPVSNGRARPERARTVLEVAQPDAIHNGGQLAFGPDGYLYVSLGDGGPRNDPEERGQDLTTLLGSILRLDVSETPYAIPPDNPFVDDAQARDEIWAYGLRNPWRFSFAPDGALWIADVGETRVEEVNREAPPSRGGHNYGWSRLEGDRCFGWRETCDLAGTVLPVLTYDRGTGWGGSVTGGHVYRGDAIPSLRGAYVFGDFVGGTVLAARPAGLTSVSGGTGWDAELLLDAGLPITSFGVAPSGELLLTDYGGSLQRLVPR